MRKAGKARPDARPQTGSDGDAPIPQPHMWAGTPPLLGCIGRPSHVCLPILRFGMGYGIPRIQRVREGSAQSLTG